MTDYDAIAKQARDLLDRLADDKTRSETRARPNDESFGDYVKRMIPRMRLFADAIAGPELAARMRAPEFWAFDVWPWDDLKDAVAELTGICESTADVARLVEPLRPSLRADNLHPWVWAAAGSLWDDGHFRAALGKVGASIDAELQAKLGRYDATGTALMNQAFSDDGPKPGAPRLRFRNYRPDTESYRNALAGARSFAAGCCMRIRNLAAHGLDEIDQQSAVEQLASLSLLARWIDEADVVTADES